MNRNSENSSKSAILNKIRAALTIPTINPFPYTDSEKSLYFSNDETKEVLFASNFRNAEGKFIYSSNFMETILQLNTLINENKWKNITCTELPLFELLNKHIKNLESEFDYKKTKVNITTCECLIARTGSIMISSASGRTKSIAAPIHLVIANSNQIYFDIEDALKSIEKKYGNNLPSMISIITGPSRTADIEKTLVLGAHGPKELYLLLKDQ